MNTQSAPADVTTIHGVGVNAGRAVGPVVLVAERAPAPEDRTLAQDADLQAQTALVDEASAAVSAELFERAAQLEGETRTVVETTAAMALDPSILTPARQAVTERRLEPARAVWEAAEQAAVKLGGAGGYLAERVADVVDVRDRLIAHLTGSPVPGIPSFDTPSVLVARDLSPVDTAGLDPNLVLAIVTAEGGPTSHTAILARALGIPAIVAAREVLPAARSLTPGQEVLVDAREGTVVVGADTETVEQFRAGVIAADVPPFDGEGRTADGHRVPLYANVASLADARAAVQAGAEGVGLLRTEVLFMNRTTEPDEETQTAAYVELLEPFAGKKVVVRTLDAGADKPVPYLTEEGEPNPALGVRGLRTARRRPQVLEHQFRAIAAAAQRCQAQVRVMVPMVSTVEEVEMLTEMGRRCGLEEVGIMIETPSAALLAGPMLSQAAFASLGTNDLVQYTMAADRCLGELADLSTPWQPAVLRLIASACQGGEQQAREVSVCGEAAADPALAVVMVGLGATALSMSAVSLHAVAAVLARTDLETCRRLAGLALGCDSAEAARATVESQLPALKELNL